MNGSLGARLGKSMSWPRRDICVPSALNAVPVRIDDWRRTDRRRLISGALLAQVGACALLALLALGGWAGPASVLSLVFVCGCCTAVLTPAWNSAVVDPVPRGE